MGVIMKNKINYTGGGGGGSATLEGLTDVDLTTPTDGQALVYDETNDVWVNGNVSGGGGGGSARYKEEVLWENANGLEFYPSSPQTVLLSDSIRNYDILCFVTSAKDATAYKNQSLVPVSEILNSGTSHFSVVNVGGHVYNTPSINYVDDTHVKFNGYSSDYHLYAYKVIGIKWETMQTALIYSEEEREVGVWTDGKPLYAISAKLTSLTQNAWNNIDFNVDADVIDTLVEIKGAYRRDSDGWSVALNFWESTSAYATHSINKNTTTGKARLSYLSRATTGTVTVTMYYTKTTDTAGSGTWTTTGEYAHHYSISEKVVGTWIDGKPLYEKTINVGHNYGSPSSSVRALDYDISALNVKNVVNADGFYVGDGSKLPYITQNLQYSCYLFVTYSTIQIRRGQSLPYSDDSYVTIQYTKTTDV